MLNFRMQGTGDGAHVETCARGREVLRTPLLNKGSAFTENERAALGLTGLLPHCVKPLEAQAERAYAQYQRQTSDLGKYIYLNALHNRNEVLFYRLIADHLQEMLPIVYTPTVGVAIEQYSHEYRHPRGVYLSINHPEQIAQSFRNFGAGPDDIDMIVATDAEEILGIGDWGVGGIDIAIGKLAVYTAAAGIDPGRVIPVMLDTGTNRQSLLDDPFYIGNRHERVRGERYDKFIDAYVRTAMRCFPNALLHWEDFGANNGRRIVERYRDHVCTFNDDIQGTGSVAMAAVMAAMRIQNAKLSDQRIIIFGAGSAGIGIAEHIGSAMQREGLSTDETLSRFWCFGRKGLITQEIVSSIRDFQVPYARSMADVAGWHREDDGSIGLLETVRRVKPTIMIGTSTTPKAFSEEIVRTMAEYTERPVIMPLSNPTVLSEAVPANLIAWTDGRALVATGSPFGPVTHNGVTYSIGQANNALVFPGLGLGAIVSRASRMSDGMFAAAAEAVAEQVDITQDPPSLLPPVENLREISTLVAVAVANEAAAEGLAQVPLDNTEKQVRDSMWSPQYHPVIAV